MSKLSAIPSVSTCLIMLTTSYWVENALIYDITSLVNIRLDGTNFHDNLPELAQFHNVAYRIDASHSNFIWKLEQVVSSVANLTLNEGGRVPKIWIFIQLSDDITTYEQSLDIVVSKYFSDNTFKHVARFILNLHNGQPCEIDTSPLFHFVEKWSENANINFTHTWGIGYSEETVRCTDKTSPTAFTRYLNFDSITVEFLPGMRFPESYGLFVDYLKRLKKEHIGHIEAQRYVTGHTNDAELPIVVFRIRLFSPNKESKREDEFVKTFQKYQILLRKFASMWISQENEDIILDMYNQPPPTGDNFQFNAFHKTRIVDNFNAVVIGGGKDIFGGTFLETKYPCSYPVVAYGNQVSTFFQRASLNMNGWLRIVSRCKNTYSTLCRRYYPLCRNGSGDFPKKEVTYFLDVTMEDDDFELVEGKPYLNMTVGEIWNAIREHRTLGMMSVTGVLFESKALEHFIKISGDTLTEWKTLSGDISTGCTTNFGSLGTFKDFQGISSAQNSQCGYIANLSRYFVWEFTLEFKQLQEMGFSEGYLQIQNILHKIYLVRQDFLKGHPGTDVILKVNNFEVASKSVYCNDTELQKNQFYEALVTWAGIHNVTIIPRYVFTFSRGWFQTIVNTRRPEMRFFVSRNNPQTMGFMQKDPCIKKETQVPSTGIPFSGKFAGTSVKLNMVNRSMSTGELQVMLLFAMQKYQRVEIVLGEESRHEQFSAIVWRVISPQLEQLMTNNDIEGRELFLELPLTHDEREFRTNLQILKKTAASMNTKLLVLQGIHFSDWEPHRKSELLQRTLNELGDKTRFNIGLSVKDCTGEIGNIILDNKDVTGLIFQNLSYIICDEEPIVGSNTDSETMSRHLDRHLFTKKYFNMILPNVAIYHRLHTRYSFSEKDENYLKYLNDFSQYATAYEINFFTNAFQKNMHGFDPGWWRIANYDDLGNPSVYFDSESEFLNRPQWRPRASTINEPSGAAIALYVILVLFVCGLTLGFGKLRHRNKLLLTKKEVVEFRRGGEVDSMFGNSAQVNEYGDDLLLANLKFNPEFEIPLDEIRLCRKRQILGFGNFGVVHRAKVNDILVAVKVPKEGCSKEAFIGMLNEVKVMCYVGAHHNVLEFVGAYTKEVQQGKLYVATKMCGNGSLERFLRKKQCSVETQKGKEACIKGSVGTNNVCMYELIRFSFEIASGMEYISSKHVVHGDLSTRNVLLDEHYICKIGDFGLSRKLYDYQYVKSNEQPLPWRWMAYESLKRMEFSVKSDVWSYGVTLWEIFSLGDIPYPGLSWSADFVDEIRNGLRSSRPPFATSEIYDKMIECWNLQPDCRPTFLDLSTFFQSLRQMEYSKVV